MYTETAKTIGVNAGVYKSRWGGGGP